MPCGLLGLGIAASASAQDAATLEPRTQNNTTFISGGVGKDEAQLADAISRYGYNVQLVFAEQTGAFLADVDLHITDAAGKTVLDTVSEGPMFLAKLPPGQYRVAAQANGAGPDRDSGREPRRETNDAGVARHDGQARQRGTGECGCRRGDKPRKAFAEVASLNGVACRKVNVPAFH